MAENIGFCGNDCDYCEMKFGVIAKNVDSLMQNLRFLGIFNQLKNYGELNSVFEKEDEFYLFLNELKENFGECSGCKSRGLPFCEVRKCAIENKMNSCTKCKKYENCEKMKFDSWQDQFL
jgi:hypothetical protein